MNKLKFIYDRGGNNEGVKISMANTPVQTVSSKRNRKAPIDNNIKVGYHVVVTIHFWMGFLANKGIPFLVFRIRAVLRATLQF